MSTELTTRGVPASDLTITTDQTFFTQKQIAALAQLGVDRANNADLAVFFHQATRTGLDPFARQIYMIERQGKQTIQTGIDGFRLVARRATDRSAASSFGYEDTLWCGEDGRWTDVWLSKEPPAAAKVTVLRDGQRYPAIALHSEYVALKRDGNPNSMWRSKPALMLAKCAEALALRKAFPQDLSGLYTSDEMGQADNVQQAPASAQVQVQQSSRSGSARLAAAVQERAAASSTSAPEPEPTPEPASQESDGITAAQHRKIGALMRDVGITERDAAIAVTSQAIGRQIKTRNDLTAVEAGKVIDVLTGELNAINGGSGDAEDLVDGEVVEGGEAR